MFDFGKLLKVYAEAAETGIFNHLVVNDWGGGSGFTQRIHGRPGDKGEADKFYGAEAGD